MAKQTVINSLKTCINIYIVLPGRAFFGNQSWTRRSWDDMARQLLFEVVFRREIYLFFFFVPFFFVANFLNRYF